MAWLDQSKNCVVAKYKPVIHGYGLGLARQYGGNGGQYRTFHPRPKIAH